ncbi:PREDICTED: tetratricopeptide repeat protein 27 [Rhagoletis zephyria]|uniref:tetratricopeptide repeat protein 27 n=1 Tax=Rhagoletis zephyria TaxID=28612 RepID=UPI000811563C|nr:PREDICTED: tetratricopeptide repeat protein 27 [Rhagoletis zephyria]
MCEEPFNKYHLCNFNELVVEQDLPTESLHQLWSCKWTTTRLQAILDNWFQYKNAEPSLETADTLLCQVVELTLVFVQNNFTGPFKQLEEFTVFLQAKQLKEYDPFICLMENGEEINPNVKLGELLVLAKEILNFLRQRWPESLYLQWWYMRIVHIQQQVIDELTNNLYEELKVVAEFLLKNVDKAPEKELQALLYLEVANGYLLFHRSQKCDETLEELCQRLGIVLNIEGLLGLRTKFQQKPLPQLCLKVQHCNTELPSAQDTNSKTNLPKLLLLDDDTRLERIRFIEPKDNEVMTLPSVLQALVLARVKQLKRSQPKDRLADEELEPYIKTLLYQEHGPLQVRQSALLLNCVQESNQRRTVERSWKQCEGAVKLLDSHIYTLPERLSYAFAGFLQPKWQVQRQLCELLLSLGMTKTALDIYLQIQAWAEVIQCYTKLDLRHKAAEIIQQELAKKPTVLLHCLLGDAIDDPNCYATAWEFSKHTSGRAQAHWGSYYFRKAEYAEAIPHLEKSVEINSLQEKIWLRLGYAAIKLERWELAVHAYITYTHIESLGFESWNNLAKALVKLGDKKRAHKVLSESLKCNYNNWKVWENFMIVSVDTCNLEDAMNAYSRLSELKDRYLDLEVLCVTIGAILEGKADAKGQTQERLRKKAITLLAQQCVKHGNEPKVWELAALLAVTPLNTAQKLVKSVNAYTTKELEWATKQLYALKVIQICQQACELSLEATNEHTLEETEVMITSQLNSARLAAQAVIRATAKVNEKWPENEAALAELREKVDSLTLKVKERMHVS